MILFSQAEEETRMKKGEDLIIPPEGFYIKDS